LVSAGLKHGKVCLILQKSIFALRYLQARAADGGERAHYTEAVIEEREQGIQEIQQQIVEVNEIFRDLAVLVKEQGVFIGGP